MDKLERLETENEFMHGYVRFLQEYVQFLKGRADAVDVDNNVESYEDAKARIRVNNGGLL